MFWTNLLNLCNEANTTPTAVVKELGIAAGSVTKWKNGSAPRGTTLQKLANYFSVSVEYLLDKPETPALSPEKQKILDACENLSPEQLEKVVEYVEFITAKKRSGD